MNEQFLHDAVVPRTDSSKRRMRFGAELTDSGTTFRLWAPYCKSIGLLIGDDIEPRRMKRLLNGWFELTVAGARAGTRYRFVLPDGTEVPDPASRFLPADVHGPSEVIDPRAYKWRDVEWTGRAWEEAIFYELHVGTFTTEGTFRAAIDKLPELVELGVTAIELLPIGDFPGRFNWGYDGVALYAPDAGYGRPDDLKALVDAAHGAGLMVFLDVVYNHFGPDGNYMQAYAPLLSDKHGTDYGKAPNVDDRGAAVVRDFLISNALFWLTEYHFDGLRLDAVHAIADDGPKHFLEELAERVKRLDVGRQLHVVVENSRNEAGWLKRNPDRSPAFFVAQWNDDVHHALHRIITGETYDYYADYDDGLEKLGRALAEGFAYQGDPVPSGERKGEPSAFLPPTAFVSYLQNHDQTGNRPRGERITQIAAPAQVRAATALYLLSPHIPLIFMGEEWGASTPFPYFTDVTDDLADAIRKSRKEQLAEWPEIRDREPVPDPVDCDTFLSARLRWDERSTGMHAEYLSHFRGLIGVRKSEIIPRIAGIEGHAGRYAVIAGRGLEVSWRLADGGELRVLANLSPLPLGSVDTGKGRRIWLEGEAGEGELAPWSVLWTVLDAPAG